MRVGSRGSYTFCGRAFRATILSFLVTTPVQHHFMNLMGMFVQACRYARPSSVSRTSTSLLQTFSPTAGTADTFHSLFNLQCGKSDIQQCPNCHQCCLELALAVSTAQVVPPLPIAYHAQKRYAFSAALWAPAVNCQDELSKYLAEAIHVGYSLQRAIHTHERSDDIDTVLLTERGLRRHTDGFGLLEKKKGQK